jgi:hypothetical protein
MLLKDLKGHIYEDVCIYTHSDDNPEEFPDLYCGDFREIPEELLNCEVGAIGVGKKY